MPLSDETKCKLIGELDGIRSADDLMLWALRRLPLKNRLQAEDARKVEAAYLARLQQLDPKVEPEAAVQTKLVTAETIAAEPDPASSADGVILLPKTSRRRDKEHLAFVTAQPCLVCQRTPSDAHHLKFAQPRALGRKVSDEFTVPLCRKHHDELHRAGNEQGWWANLGITPLPKADELWRTSRRRNGAAEPEPQAAQSRPLCSEASP